MFEIFKPLTQFIPSLPPKLPQFKLPQIKLPQMPKLPQVKLPQMPQVKLPQMPQVKLPQMPQVKLPQMPQVKLPQIPKLPTAGSLGVPVTAIALPALAPLTLGAGAASAASGAFEDVGRFITGGGSSVASAASGAVSAGASGAGSVYRKVYESYDDAEKKMESSDPDERLEGFGQYAGTTAFHVLAPVELGNVLAAHAEGRADELTMEDYAWAGFDALFLASIPFTGGLGWAARSGIRAGLKGVGKSAVKGGNMGFLSRLISPLSKVGRGLRPAAKMARPTARVARPAARVARPAARVARPAARVARPAARVARPAATVARPGSSMASMIRPGVRTASGASSIRPIVKVAGSAPKKSLLRPLGMAGAAGLGVAGLTALTIGAGDPGAGYPEDPYLTDPYYDPYGTGEDPYYDPYGTGGDPFWDFGPGGVPPLDDPFWDPNAGGYTPPSYPGGEYLAPAEAYSQDMLEYVPFGDEAVQRGIAFPVLLLGVVVIGGGGYYLYKNYYKKGSKTGKTTKKPARKSSGGRK